jgi:hypothetical protein
MLTTGELYSSCARTAARRIERACTSSPTVTVVDSTMVGDLRMWLDRDHLGNPQQMRRRRPLSSDKRTPPPAGLRLHPV